MGDAVRTYTASYIAVDASNATQYVVKALKVARTVGLQTLSSNGTYCTVYTC